MSVSAFILCFAGSLLFVAVVFIAACIRIVGENKRLSVHRLGRHIGNKGPGVALLIPIIDRGVVKDLDSPLETRQSEADE